MDQGLDQQQVIQYKGSPAGTSTKVRTVKVYVFAAIEFWIATDAVVAAIRLGEKDMSNWFIFPLILAAFLLAASATYAIAYHRLSSVFQMTKGRLPTAGTAGSGR